MGSKPVSPRFAGFVDTAASAIPWVMLAIGAGLMAFSIWGIRACRSMARFYSELSAPGLIPLTMVLIWCFLFGPFAAFGVYILRKELRQMRMSRFASGSQSRADVRILPPQTAATRSPTPVPASVDPHVSQPVTPESFGAPLDDATVHRLSELAQRSAKALNVGAAWFLLICGLLGFVWMWIYSHTPHNFSGFVMDILQCSAIAVLVGLAILRDVYKKT